jgi:hypothetical protein
MTYWLTPVGPIGDHEPPEVVSRLVGERGVFGFSERNPARRRIRSGDSIAFYARGLGVVGHARVVSGPTPGHDPEIPEKYSFVVELGDVTLYTESPLPLDEARRMRLDGLRAPHRSWAWFVHSTREVSGRDFRVLTGGR